MRVQGLFVVMSIGYVLSQPSARHIVSIVRNLAKPCHFFTLFSPATAPPTTASRLAGGMAVLCDL